MPVADMLSHHDSGVVGLQVGDDKGLGAVCPRCGYDLRGIVAAWRESCPLSGTCAECGLEFGWEYILRPDRLTPRWCIEFVPRRRGIPMAAAKTLLRSFWPWGFWKRMHMAFPVRWRRLAIYILLLLIVPPTTLYVGVRASAAAYVRWKQQLLVDQMLQGLPSAIVRMQAIAIRPTHVGPNAVLPSLRIVAMSEVQQRINAEIAMLQQSLTTPPVIEHSYAAAIYEAVCKPLAEQSSGRIRGWPGTGAFMRVPYPVAPDEVLGAAVYLSGRSTSYSRSSWFHADKPHALGPMVMWLGVLAMMPLSLALLPVTRKRAKVRWWHIARVAAYSVFIPVTSGCLTIVAWLLDEFTDFAGLQSEDLATLVALTGMPLLGACWWAAAIKRYLRLPHALAVTALLGLLCLLTTGALMFWIGTALSD